MNKQTKCPAEVRERAVRMVLEQQSEHQHLNRSKVGNLYTGLLI